MKGKIFRMISVTTGCMLVMLASSPAQNETAKKETGGNVTQVGVWTLQANSVGDHLGLTGTARDKLIKKYIAAQGDHQTALKALPKETDKDKARAALQAAISKDRTKLLAALKDVVSDDHVAYIELTLGSFNARWDTYMKVLLDLAIEEAALASAAGSLLTYVSTYEEASKASLESYNRRPNSRSFKEKLDSELSTILTGEQFAAWKAETATGSRKSTPDKDKN